MLRRARATAAAVACWAGLVAGMAAPPGIPAAALDVPSASGTGAETWLDAAVLPPEAPPFDESRRAWLANSAIFFPGDDDGYLDGGAFVLPVPLPWPPGADGMRSWELDVPSGAPVFLLAAVSPAAYGFVPGAVAITVDGVPVPSPERFAATGLQLPEADGLQNYTALALVAPAFEPGRHRIAVGCNVCTPAPPNPWLTTINASPRTYVLNVQPPKLPVAGPDMATPSVWRTSATIGVDGGGASPDGTLLSALPVQPAPSIQAVRPLQPVAGLSHSGVVADRVFYSDALGREMSYRVYLPPGYDDPGPAGQPPTKRYAALYLLHGLGAGMKQWSDLGLVDELDRVAAAGETIPFVVVMPSGRAGYWVNHAGGGPRWGDYVAGDLVAHVDATYRTFARREARAIGGISMGAHGALQLTLNHPDVFGVVGAHSPALRTRLQAPPFLGGFFANSAGGPGQAAYESRDPISLVRRSALARAPAIWIDVGERDSWAPRARELHATLVERGWAHEWQPAAGDHDGSYWRGRLADYVRFYRRALLSGLS